MKIKLQKLKSGAKKFGLNWGDALLDKFGFYRKWRGGHWEMYELRFPFDRMIWMKRQCCRDNKEPRMHPGLLFGPLKCEDYTSKC